MGLAAFGIATIHFNPFPYAFQLGGTEPDPACNRPLTSANSNADTPSSSGTHLTGKGAGIDPILSNRKL